MFYIIILTEAREITINSNPGKGLWCGLRPAIFRMLRIEDWIFGYFFIPIIGAVAAAGDPAALRVTAIVSACILAFGFVINNVADVEIDR